MTSYDENHGKPIYSNKPQMIMAVMETLSAVHVNYMVINLDVMVRL